jgi:imidazolonepropionase-like amidohydrolase
MALSDGHTPSATETLTPLVRQLADQLRATRSATVVAKSFPEREAAARPALRGTLDAIAKAAERNHARQEAIGLLEGRLKEAEALASAQAARLAEIEGKLRASQDEAQRERARADELQRRSTELLEKTQAMLTEAGDRLSVAETRAESAEADLDYLKNFVRDRLGA